MLGNKQISSSSGSGAENLIESISVNGTTQTITNKNVDRIYICVYECKNEKFLDLFNYK